MPLYMMAASPAAMSRLLPNGSLVFTGRLLVGRMPHGDRAMAGLEPAFGASRGGFADAPLPPAAAPSRPAG